MPIAQTFSAAPLSSDQRVNYRLPVGLNHNTSKDAMGTLVAARLIRFVDEETKAAHLIRL